MGINRGRYLSAAFCVALVSGSLKAQDIDASRAAVSSDSKSDTVVQKVRKNRDLLFESLTRNAPDLRTTPTNMPPEVIKHDRPKWPELPDSKAETIVTAYLTNFTSRLSANGTAVYTEYRFVVNDVIKNSAVSQGAVIDILEMGGAVKGQNGRVYRQVAEGLGLPLETGTKYLLFLNAVPDADAYRLFKAWSIKDGHLQPSSYDDIERVKRNECQVANKSVEEMKKVLAVQIEK